jgi:prepilin-type N-terminal cleavage/methylation domain-containing protein
MKFPIFDFKPCRFDKLPITRFKFSRNGFTIIELLVGFSILAVISGLGLAAFVNISRKQTISEAVTNLKQTIDEARFKAISVVKPEVCAGSEIESYVVSLCYNENPSCSGENNRYIANAICVGVSPTPFPDRDLPVGVTFEPPDSGTPCQDIVFNIVPTSTEGVPCSVKVSGFGQTLVVSVNSKGYVSF